MYFIIIFILLKNKIIASKAHTNRIKQTLSIVNIVSDALDAKSHFNELITYIIKQISLLL